MNHTRQEFIDDVLKLDSDGFAVVMMVMDFMLSFPEQQRQTVVDLYISGVPIPEIAKRMKGGAME